ncbi:baeRF2 domain-containing protein [Salinifilum ghardaiensis]
MKLSPLRQVYGREGPFATVYLESRPPAEDANEQLRLRWKALRERLQYHPASEAALHALDGAISGSTAGEAQIDGRVLVANDSGVLLDEQWDAALGTGDAAHWTSVPELGAYVREQARAVRELVVITDQEGAQLRRTVVAEQHTPRNVDAEVVEGSAQTGVHKPRGQALSHKQIQRHADENLGRNAKDIASRASELAAGFGPDVLVLAGDPQARTTLRDELPPDLSGILAETERSGRDEGASESTLSQELVRTAQHANEQLRSDNAARLESGLAHGRSAQGAEQVAQAAEMGAVDTLLLEEGVEAEQEAYLLQKCAETDSQASLVAGGTGLRDGVAALLRFPITG